jgi:predicted kinase
MRKKLVLVAAPPACGKTYVSERLAKDLGHAVYLDKDMLAPLIRRAFALCEEEFDMDGEFYISNLRAAEYKTILDIAFSTLRFEDAVILNAPFGKEVRNIEFMHSLKDRANGMGADLILIWIYVPLEVCHERIVYRNADRDQKKIANWDAYTKKVNYSIPAELADANAVDTLYVFNGTDEKTSEASFSEAIKLLLL